MNIVNIVLGGVISPDAKSSLIKLLMPLGISKLCCENCANDLNGSKLTSMSNLKEIFQDIFKPDIEHDEAVDICRALAKFIDCPARGAHHVYYPTNSPLNEWNSELSRLEARWVLMAPLNPSMSVSVRPIDFRLLPSPYNSVFGTEGELGLRKSFDYN